MRRRWFVFLAVCGVLASGLGACSSRPRPFEPAFASPAADETQRQTLVAQCREQVAQGKRSGFASGAGTAAIGAGAAYGAGAVVMAGSGSSMAATAAGASAAVVLMPAAAVIAVVAVQHHKRNRKEDDINTAMSQCLAEQGEPVSEWRRAKR